MWGKKGRTWSLLRLQPLQIPVFFLWNIFPHVIFKANCFTLITELLMWPDEGSSCLLCFGTPALTIPSPGWLLCSYCCQQDCFPFGFLMNISKVYFAFLLVVPRCVAFHLLTLNPYADLSGACRLRQLPMPHLPRIAADVPGHIPSSSHVSRASASSPGSVLCTMQLP